MYITGKPSESVGEEAAASLVTDIQSGSCVDSYLQDQVLATQYVSCVSINIECHYWNIRMGMEI